MTYTKIRNSNDEQTHRHTRMTKYICNDTYVTK